MATALSREGRDSNVHAFQHMTLSRQNSRDTLTIRPAISPSLSPIGRRWFSPACSVAVFALYPTWGEFPHVPFSATMTNWASSIAAGDTDFAHPRAYRARLVTCSGFASIYSSTTIAISTTPVDRVNHLKPPALSYHNFSSSYFLCFGLLSALYHLLSQRREFIEG
jgi:hypothetical protein